MFGADAAEAVACADWLTFNFHYVCLQLKLALSIRKLASQLNRRYFINWKQMTMFFMRGAIESAILVQLMSIASFVILHSAVRIIIIIIVCGEIVRKLRVMTSPRKGATSTNHSDRYVQQPHNSLIIFISNVIMLSCLSAALIRQNFYVGMGNICLQYPCMSQRAHVCIASWRI